MALTAAQICTYARQAARCPGYTNQSGDFLNRILESLAQNYDLPNARYTYVNFPIGPNAGNGYNTQFYVLDLSVIGPGVTYLRTKEVFYQQQGTIFFISQIALENYDKLFQGTGISNYPYWFTVNVEPTLTGGFPQMAFYPPPNLSLLPTIRLQYQPADIATPENSSAIPWFPNQKYLITQLTADLMLLTGDQRQAQYDASARDQLLHYMKMDDDNEGFAQVVKLDPTRFRSVSDLKPTKTTGF